MNFGEEARGCDANIKLREQEKMYVYLCAHPESAWTTSMFRDVCGPLVTHELGWNVFTLVDSPSSADSVVTLTPASVLRARFNNPQNLSLCDMSTRNVYVNEDRWFRHVPDASHLPLVAYRAYIIQHELGHALGLEHEIGCFVMNQQTLGIGDCRPFPFPHFSERQRLFDGDGAQSRHVVRTQRTGNVVGHNNR